MSLHKFGYSSEPAKTEGTSGAKRYDKKTRKISPNNPFQIKRF